MKKIVAVPKPKVTISSNSAKTTLLNIFTVRGKEDIQKSTAAQNILEKLIKNYEQRKATGCRVKHARAQDKFNSLAAEIVKQKRKPDFIYWARKQLSSYASTHTDLTLPDCIKIDPISFSQGERTYALSELSLDIPEIVTLSPRHPAESYKVTANSVVYLQTYGCIFSISYRGGDFFEFNYINSLAKGQINLGTFRSLPVDQILTLGSAEYSDIPIDCDELPKQLCKIEVDKNHSLITITNQHYIEGLSTEVGLYKPDLLV
ncbi:hypothetical protein HOC37_00685 [bacterium]|nr:hypothetical protein [bacterium]MBT4551481.1 hypothetical protein [bacterium]